MTRATILHLKSASIGLGVGMLLGAALVSCVISLAWGPPGHDPQKLLSLREACLKHDPSLFTSYCDDYAETYSRIYQK